MRGVYVDRLVGQVELYNTYDLSETTVCAFYCRCNDGTVLEDETYPIGCPVRNAVISAYWIRIGMNCLTEKQVKFAYMKTTYLSDISETTRKKAKPFKQLADGGTMYRSGDLGYILSDGNIAFLHRKDTQIMIAGKRVEIMEVEVGLYGCIGIEQAIVRVFTDEDGLSYMTVYIVPSTQDMKMSEIRRELSENLAAFMILKFIVRMPQIPLNSNGKPDTARLSMVMKAGA